MADERDSLLREVEEELRRDQMQKIWDRYNGVIFGAAALIVVGVGGYKYLESSRIAEAQAAGGQFAAALQLSEEKKDDDAIKAFEKIAAQGPSGYATLAKLNIAGAHARAGRTAEALATYESIANQSGGDALLKNYAQLQVASLKLGEVDYSEQENRLKPLAADDSAFKTTARELLGLSAFKAGKLDEARKYLEPLLIDQNASRAIQDRVKIIMGDIARAETGSAKPSAPEASKPDAAAPAAAGDKASDVKPAPSGETKPAEPDKK